VSGQFYPRENIPQYPLDWNLHRRKNQILDGSSLVAVLYQLHKSCLIYVLGQTVTAQQGNCFLLECTTNMFPPLPLCSSNIF
jgi:hypothetical protein